MKLRVKDRNALESVKSDLKRGVAFILSKDTAIMRSTSMTSCDTYESKLMPGKFHNIKKEVGSELCLVFNALQKLETLLNQETA